MEYELKGWVKNLPNGTVEVEIEGDDNRVEAFLSQLEDGFNPFIKVKSVSITKEYSLKGYKKFEIR